MRGLKEEDTRLLEQTKEVAKRNTIRQIARKTPRKAASEQGALKDGRRNEEQSNVVLDSDSENGKRMSEDDGETHERIFGKTGKVITGGGSTKMEKLRTDTGKLPPSKTSDKNSRHASPNGHNPVSTSDAAMPRTETPVQHDPGAWSKPSFMKNSDEGRTPGELPGMKLGGYGVRLIGLRKRKREDMAWLSWKELERILVET